MDNKFFSVGTGRAVITPPLGIDLAGFADRDHGAESVLDELELRVFWIEAEGERGGPACIICFDLIGIDAALGKQMRDDLAAAFGIQPAAVLLAASHTHCGPQTLENLIGTGRSSPAYIADLRQWCLNAVAAARENRRPAVMKVGQGVLEGGYAINRRLLVNGQITMAPNPAGIRDDQVTTISFHDPQSDQALAVLFNFACHASTMSGYAISGDYPAAARRHIEKVLPGVTAGFLQGCCGDIRANCTYIGNKRFRKGQVEDIRIFGAALGEKVAGLVRSASASFPPAIGGWTKEVRLPLEKEGEHALLLLQRLDLSEKVTLIALGGEPVADYGYFIKWLRPGTYAVPVGYANGVVAYLPTARLLVEGGYETHTSVRFFGLPSPFHPSLETAIQQSIRAIMQES
ncbi:MAG TPA: hypothetical protein GXX29_07590 [Firmicutes bacterium]|nr:hypothetical protein [Bacillota bacterium]